MHNKYLLTVRLEDTENGWLKARLAQRPPGEKHKYVNVKLPDEKTVV